MAPSNERFNVTVSIVCERMEDKVVTLKNDLLQGDMSKAAMLDVEKKLLALCAEILNQQPV